MRMPRDMVQELDRIAAATGYTRTELMMACLEISMNHMEIVQKETNGRAWDHGSYQMQNVRRRSELCWGRKRGALSVNADMKL